MSSAPGVVDHVLVFFPVFPLLDGLVGPAGG